jgi:glycosyltransferase involved in cell wall biosynthesis
MGIEITKNFNYPTLKSKAIKFVRQLVAFPDEERGWYGHAVEAASQLIDKGRIDAIISTSSPVTSHLIAKKLKQKYGLPWIADLRDLWTQNHYSEKFKVIEFFERQLEIATLSQADALVTVSEPLVDALRDLHRNKDVHCITNGYDPDDFQVSPGLVRKFTISYTGALYNGIRDPSMLFETVSDMIGRKRIDPDLIEIRFFGNRAEWLAEDVKKSGLENVVRIYGAVPRGEAISRQQESQLLLLLE